MHIENALCKLRRLSVAYLFFKCKYLFKKINLYLFLVLFLFYFLYPIYNFPYKINQDTCAYVLEAIMRC